ncbi:MAG: hypothetical protein CV087_11230 [Candidatus Brocadia sp. WS118]|nr:MAG: hypothetical protein CV087_11230 [Candidatus Brocadia sp. WS118]
MKGKCVLKRGRGKNAKYSSQLAPKLLFWNAITLGNSVSTPKSAEFARETRVSRALAFLKRLLAKPPLRRGNEVSQALSMITFSKFSGVTN